MIYVSKHISYEEATKSPTAIRNNIDNTPGIEVIKSMLLVANQCFEPLREWYCNPLRINSFYRCPELNKLVGGSPTSQHTKGEAIDIDAGSKEENKKLFDWVIKNLNFDQVINEYNFSWIHISYKKEGNRKQIIEVK